MDTSRPSRRVVLAGLASGVSAFGLAACTGNDGNSSGSDSDNADGPEIAALKSPAAPQLTRDPFTLGVASGDPEPSSVVLWTRMAPDPDAADGGLGTEDVGVVWEVARDDDFTTLLATGTATAEARWGHSVHAVADGLPADGRFHYRFRTGSFTSPVGRTRTAPAGDASVDRLVTAVASCQDYEAGYYVAHRALAQEPDLDLVLWLGDYIYEGGPSDNALRAHTSNEIMTLEDYRRRYALYRSDADLQAAHAAAPWIVIWDDHEVENNYAGLLPQDEDDTAGFAERRAAAYQAWWENQPVRMPPPDGADLPIHRDLRWGDLAHIFALDTRQARADQVCSIVPGADAGPNCPELEEPDQVMVDDAQEQWLVNGLQEGGSAWNLVANQVVFSPVPIIGEDLPAEALAGLAAQAGIGSLPPLDGLRGVMADQWDGYPLQRRRILDAMAAAPSPTIVVTGDIHASAAGPIPADPDDPTGVSVGAEFVGTSISSSNGNLAELIDSIFDPAFEYYQSSRRGYLRCELTPERTTASYVVVADATDRDSATDVDAVFEVDRNGAFART